MGTAVSHYPMARASADDGFAVLLLRKDSPPRPRKDVNEIIVFAEIGFEPTRVRRPGVYLARTGRGTQLQRSLECLAEFTGVIRRVIFYPLALFEDKTIVDDIIGTNQPDSAIFFIRCREKKMVRSSQTVELD